MKTIYGWEIPDNPLGPETRDQRIRGHYLALAGSYPGPIRSVIAAMLAHRIVDLEDELNAS